MRRNHHILPSGGDLQDSAGADSGKALRAAQAQKAAHTWKVVQVQEWMLQ